MDVLRIAAILVLAAGAAPAQTRIAGVDVGRAFRSYHRTSTEMAQIEEERAKLAADPRVEQVRQLAAEAKKATETADELGRTGEQSAFLDARRKAEMLQEELRACANALKESREESVRELNLLLVARTRTLLTAVHDTAAKLGRERGYHLVVDSTGNSNTGLPLLLYARELPDLTDDVILRLNSDAPAGEPEPAATTTADAQADPPAADAEVPVAIPVESPAGDGSARGGR